MSERRYSDEEVAVIFQAAAELQQRAALDSSASGTALTPLASSDGMTLGQLQEIGREVGIPGDLVAQAAGSLDRRGRGFVRRFLGLPIGVGRTVPLQRRLTEAEWERLVVDLRTTFDARGKLANEGSFRQWTNGNLQALLEPTPTGHQLRLKTLKGDAYTSMMMGIAMFSISALMLITKAMQGPIENFVPSFMVAMMGVALFAFGALRIPGWARTRRKQMEEIAERLTRAIPEPTA